MRQTREARVLGAGSAPLPIALGLAVLLGAGALSPALAQAPPGLPPPPVPPETQITEPKRVLGKILYWDEQVSSDSAVACGSCHTMFRAGADARIGVHPGPDGIIPSVDDIFGSPGVFSTDSEGDRVADPTFGLNVQ